MLNKIIKKKESGFTIIEVMIVLAIAGLIMVVVLIAVPQLQRNQRNQARQSILARITTELSNYAGNNNSSFPAPITNDAAGNFGSSQTNNSSFIGKYLKGVDVNDPSTGSSVEFVTAAGNVAAPTQGQVRYALSAECGSDGAISALSGQNRNFAVAIGLEGGRAYCLDNK